MAKRIVVLSILSCLALYPADDLVLRYRMARGADALGTVDVTVYYVIPLKNNKFELQSGGREAEKCANSLFPHQGLSPCWYLRRHREKRIEM